MPELTFANVEPLLKDSKVEGRTMHMLFVCPATGAEVRASAEVPNLISKGGVVGVAAASTAVGEAQGLGKAALPRGLRDVVQNTTDVLDTFAWRRRKLANRLAPMMPTAGPEDYHAAVVNAFASVADQFRWDEAGSRWVKAAPPGA